MQTTSGFARERLTLPYLSASNFSTKIGPYSFPFRWPLKIQQYILLLHRTAPMQSFPFSSPSTAQLPSLLPSTGLYAYPFMSKANRCGQQWTTRETHVCRIRSLPLPEEGEERTNQRQIQKRKKNLDCRKECTISAISLT